MARTVNIHEAKTHFSKLVEAAERGEEIIIARRGKPVLKLVPVEQPPRKLRIGWAKGLFPEIEAIARESSLIKTADEDFDEWYKSSGDAEEWARLLEKPAP